MEIDKIKSLLRDFYDGNTSLEEEEALLRFFKSGKMPENLQEEKVIFLSCYNPDQVEVPAHLDEKMNILIEKNAQAHLNKKAERKIDKIIWLKCCAVAASFLIIFTIGFKAYETNHDSRMTDTYSNPYDAYRETRKALTLISRNLNLGIAQAKKADKEIAKAHHILNNQLGKISNK